MLGHTEHFQHFLLGEVSTTTLGDMPSASKTIFFFVFFCLNTFALILLINVMMKPHEKVIFSYIHKLGHLLSKAREGVAQQPSETILYLLPLLDGIKH